MGTILFLILLVGIGAWMLRRFGGPSEETAMRERESRAVGSGARILDADDLDDDDDHDHDAVAVTSDGWAFVPHQRTVQLLPVGAEEGWAAKTHLAVGDLIAARVVRGAPSVDPWRLEALGRDHDFRAWPFETESAARAALELVQRFTVRPPRDEEGDPIPVGEEDFFVAQRKLDESAAQSSFDLPEDLDGENR